MPEPDYQIETDGMGVEFPLYAAQTQRASNHFAIGNLAYLRDCRDVKAAAQVIRLWIYYRLSRVKRLQARQMK